MFAILHALGMLVADLFKSRRQLEAEIVFLRHQPLYGGLRLVFGCAGVTERYSF